MKPYRQADPIVVVIFGAAGDLTWRRLTPAMYHLFLDKWLGERFVIIGLDRKSMSNEEFRAHLRDGVDTFSRSGKVDPKKWKEFSSRISYRQADFADPAAYRDLARKLEHLEKEWVVTADKIFYLAIPPGMIRTVTSHIGKAKLNRDTEHNRLVIEKPFGHSHESAKELNLYLQTIFSENQLYRIDHYLGKETVQNILAFRFANSLFEPIWNRRYIDHIQITVAEQIGIGHRGAYYEHAGAMRDMVQNHLLQLMCLTAMEPPVSYHADEIRNKKVDVLHAIRPIPPEKVGRAAVRGQYYRGWIEGEKVKGYREEEDVDPKSVTETFAAVKFFVDNWRWQDVPFYLRTGKRMPARESNIVIQFLAVPHQSFPSMAVLQPQPNRLIIHIQPEEGITIRFQAKKPGEVILLSPVDMKFSYLDSFKTKPPEAYETLLLDVMLGDPTQFMRGD